MVFAIQQPASIAFAEAAVVVLRNRRDLRGELASQELATALGRESAQLRIRQAELRTVRLPYAADQTEPLGMQWKIQLRRHECVVGVHEPGVAQVICISRLDQHAIE